MNEQCKTCNGAGLVLTDLRRFGFGQGFAAFMTAGIRPLYDTEGRMIGHEIVCPRCNGGKEEPR